MELIPDETLKEILEIFDREKIPPRQVLSTAYQLMLMIVDKPEFQQLNGEFVMLNGVHIDMQINITKPKQEVVH